MSLLYQRFFVHVVDLDPIIGSEISKSRPCVIISPDEMNRYLNTVIIAPLTSTHKPWPTRIDTVFQEKKGQIVLDQIRTVSIKRLGKAIGRIDDKAQADSLNCLAKMFSA